MPVKGDVGFNKGDECPCDLTSSDGSVTITETPTGYDITVEHKICELMSELPDNGLVIGG